MKINELENILQRTPSVSGNTYGVVALMIFGGILGAACFILSLGLFLESWLGHDIFMNSISSLLRLALPEEQRAGVALTFGLIGLVLAVIFLGVVRICKMVLRRNQFIMELEDWIADNISSLPKKSSRARSAKK